MGRGAYEHNYARLELPELVVQAADTAPVEIPLAPELTGNSSLSVDVCCADNLALLERNASAWAGRFQLIYLDPPSAPARSTQRASPGAATGRPGWSTPTATTWGSTPISMDWRSAWR